MDKTSTGQVQGISQNALWGFVNKKPRWSLAPRSWCLLLTFATIAIVLLFYRVHPFLAVNRPISCDLLVVEGWIPDYAIRMATQEFKTGPYQRVFTTGGPVGAWRYAAQSGGTFAGFAARRLEGAGLNTNAITIVPSAASARERTYGAAKALRAWFDTNGVVCRQINVVTLGTHARRTSLIYRQVLGDGTQVGIVAVPSEDYDAQRWWRSSAGTKEVISEGVAYLYTRLSWRAED